MSEQERRWTVHRLWRNVPGQTVTEAVEQARPGEQDETRATVQYKGVDGLAQLYYTRDELDLLMVGVATTLADTERVLQVAQSAVIRTDAQRRWNVLNSLRTSLAEARYGLMTQAEINAERAAQAAGEAAGIIKPR